MKKRRRLEREFGVPFAGELKEPAQWTQTAVKRLPPEGPLDRAALFGRTAPLVVDLGCGNGRFLLGSAVWRPDHDHLGIDLLPLVLRYATRRGNRRGLNNLRFACVDAQTFVGRYLADGSVCEVHCYHPQPFHDPREIERRMLTPAFLAEVVRVLEPAGRFFVQTDNGPYWRYLQAVVPSFFELREQPGPWPDAPKGRTRREILDLRHGIAVHRGWGTPRATQPTAAARTALPHPDFDAGPRLRDVDRRERE